MPIRRGDEAAQLQCPREYSLEHFGSQPTRILIVAGAVIAIDQDAAAGDLMLRRMAETRLGRRPAKRADDAVVRDAAQRDIDSGRHKIRMTPEVGPAGRDLCGQRLVRGRQAAHGIEDERPFWLVALRQSQPRQGREQQVARGVARERAAGTIGAVPAGCQANDHQPCVGVAERRHRRIPPLGLLGPQRRPQIDQAWAQRAVAMRFMAWRRHRVAIGGLAWGRQAM